MSFIASFPSVAAIPPSDGDIVVAGFSEGGGGDPFGIGVIGVDPTNGDQDVVTSGGLLDAFDPRVAVNDNNGNIIVAEGDVFGTDFIRINPANGDQELITTVNSFVKDIDTDSNGDIIAIRGATEILPCEGSAVIKVDAVTGERTIVSCEGLLGDLIAVAVDDSSGDIIVLNKIPGAFGSNDYELIRVNPANGAQELITTIESFDVIDIDTDPNGNIIVITSFMETLACNGTAVVKIDAITGNEELISCGGLLEDLLAVAVDDSSGNITVVSDDFPFPEPGFGTHLIGVNPDTGDQELIDLAFIDGFGDLDIFPGLVIPPEKADLSVSKTAPDSVQPGEQFGYEITVVNNGPLPAPLVTLTDVLPDDFGLSGIIIEPPSAASCITPGQFVICDLGTMQSGDSVTFSIFGTVQFSAKEGDTLINTVQVSSTAPDDFPDNNEATTMTLVAFEDPQAFTIKFECVPELFEFVLGFPEGSDVFTPPEFTRDGVVIAQIGPVSCDFDEDIFMADVPNDFHSNVLIQTPDGIFFGLCDIDVPEPPNFEISFDVVGGEVVCTPGSSTLVVLSVIPIQTIVGGDFLPIETTSLLLAGAQSFSWMIPVVLSGIGIGLFAFSRKSENS